MTSSLPLRTLGAVGLAAVLTLAACGGGGDDEETSDRETTTTEAAEETTTTEAETTTTTEAETTTTAEEETTTTSGGEGELVPFSFTDDFETDTGWLIGCDEDAGSCALVQDGRLAEALDAGSKGFDQHQQFDGQILTNLSISVKILDFSGEPEAGVVCHYDPETESYYDFTIRGDGTGSVYKFVNGEGTELAERFEVPLFTNGNEFITATCTIEADGSVHVTMEANFETVVDVVDSTDPLPPGQIALVTYGDPAVDGSVSFDDLEMEGEIYVE